MKVQKQQANMPESVQPSLQPSNTLVKIENQKFMPWRF